MADNTIYEREIRAPNGTIYAEIFSTEAGDMNYQQHTYVLKSTTARGQILGRLSRRHHIAGGKTVDGQSTVPSWWRPPSNPEGIAQKYRDNGRQCLPTSRNVVTFATYLSDSRIALQERDYVSKGGVPVGNPGKRSINGGLMESDNIEENLRRKAMEELGVDIGCYFRREGNLYDAEAGRSNHVYRITVGYDELLGWQYETQEAIKRLVGSPWENIGEGIGRTFVYAENLEAMIEKGDLTPISVAILRAFPSLMPSPRPT